MDIKILGRELAINKYVFIFHHTQDSLAELALHFLRFFFVCPSRRAFEGLFDDVLGWGTRDIAKKVLLSLIVHRFKTQSKSSELLL